jgi:hypothetical protein
MREGKENEVPDITLDFKKKNKPRPNTERKDLAGSGLKVTIGQELLTLIEKKKQYSLTIREKNLSGRKSRDELDFGKSSGKVLSAIVADNFDDYEVKEKDKGKEIQNAVRLFEQKEQMTYGRLKE